MSANGNHPELDWGEIGPEMPTIERRSACVDWLTVTCKDLDLQRRVHSEVVRLTTISKNQGNVQRPWAFKGYTGWSIAGLRWGVREDSSIVMLSGEAAALNWPPLLAWATNVTRLDVAVTIDLAEPRLHLARDAYEFLTVDGTRPCGGGSRRYSLTVNSAGGETLYVGSRASDQFGRLYDKGREQTDEAAMPTGKLWRYEVEFKADRASRVSNGLLASAKRKENSATDDIGATVYKWFLSRGVAPIWKDDKGIPYATETYAKLTDDDVTLRWLSTGVSPSVQRLIAHGRGTEVLIALGLSAD